MIVLEFRLDDAVDQVLGRASTTFVEPRELFIVFLRQLTML